MTTRKPTRLDIARFVRNLALAASLMALAACGEPTCTPASSLTLSAASATAQVGATIAVSLAGDAACEGAEDVQLQVDSGGGALAQKAVNMNPTGKVDWTLGVAPVANTLSAPDANGTATLTVVGAIGDEPVKPTMWGGVHEYMEKNGLDGTTEDLAIRADGTMALGIDGGVLEIKTDASGEHTFSTLKLSGDKLTRAHGLAYDRKGVLWTADISAGALASIDPDGKVTSHLTTNGDEPLQGPNYVAIDGKDRVVLSDPCLGELIFYDPSAKSIVSKHLFDLKTEGGPNGFAFNATGTELMVVTENTVLLCPKAKVKPKNATDNIAGLYRIKWTNDGANPGFGERTLVQTGIGLFGDGMAYDSEGNLYVVVDTVKNVALEESRVMVLRKGESELVPFVAFKKDTLIANVAFGRGPLGETTMYAALLAIPPFTTADKRGVATFEVGIAGQPLL